MLTIMLTMQRTQQQTANNITILSKNYLTTSIEFIHMLILIL